MILSDSQPASRSRWYAPLPILIKYLVEQDSVVSALLMSFQVKMDTSVTMGGIVPLFIQ